MSIGEVPAAARRQAGLTITQVSQRTCIRETIIRGSKSTTSPLAAATSMRAGTSASSLVPRAWTASRWSGSTTPATARHSPAPLPTCPGRPLPLAQAAPQAGLGRRAAGRARGLPGRCQCRNQRRHTPAGAAALTVITGQFLVSATDYPFCTPPPVCAKAAAAAPYRRVLSGKLRPGPAAERDIPGGGCRCAAGLERRCTPRCAQRWDAARYASARSDLLASPDGIPQDLYRVAHSGPAAFGEVAG